MINITDNRVNLQKSFEQLKSSLNMTQTMFDDDMQKTAFVRLAAAVEKHLKECTLPESKEGENNPDDLPDIFGKMGELFNPNNNKL